MKAIVEVATEIFHNCETEKHPKGNLPSTCNFSEQYKLLKNFRVFEIIVASRWGQIHNCSSLI